jgi:hypothetical protein
MMLVAFAYHKASNTKEKKFARGKEKCVGKILTSIEHDYSIRSQKDLKRDLLSKTQQYIRFSGKMYWFFQYIVLNE